MKLRTVITSLTVLLLLRAAQGTALGKQVVAHEQHSSGAAAEGQDGESQANGTGGADVGHRQPGGLDRVAEGVLAGGSLQQSASEAISRIEEAMDAATAKAASTAVPLATRRDALPAQQPADPSLGEPGPEAATREPAQKLAMDAAFIAEQALGGEQQRGLATPLAAADGNVGALHDLQHVAIHVQPPELAVSDEMQHGAESMEAPRQPQHTEQPSVQEEHSQHGTVGGQNTSQAADAAAAASAQEAASAAEQGAEDTEEERRRRQQAEEAAEAAERAARADRQQRLHEAEAELRRAKDWAGWAADEEGVDVRRGIALLQAMFARLDAHIDAALGQAATQRRLFTPLPSPPEQNATAAGGSAADGGQEPGQSSDGAQAASQGADGSQEPAAGAAAAGTSDDASAAAAAAASLALPPLSLDEEAHPELAPLSAAAYALACLYSSGVAADHGLPRDDRAAVYALHRAALAGSVEARVALTQRYSSGRGVPRMLEEALGQAKLAGPVLLAALDEAGSINSEAGGHLRRKWMDPAYLPAANAWEDANTLAMEQDAAARGDVEAHRQLGYRMLMGQGVPRDLAGAHRAFVRAARGGDAYAAFNLGFMHIRGWHVPQDFARAREHFLEAAARGMPAALNGLGVLYFHGQGVPANMSEAFRYFAAAAGEDHDAAYNLGTMHQGGHSVPRNMSAALELFHAAVGLGSWRAAHQLFLVHADGLHGAPKRPDRALRSFWRFMAMTGGWKEAGQEAADRAAEHDVWGAALRYALLAEQGHSLAQLNLAWLLHRGGVVAGAERHRLALPLWLRAAACNQTEGMLMAGHLLRDGHKWGLPGGANLARAVELYRSAAAAGSIEGLYTMGRLLERGLGVQRNVSEAIRLYTQAVHTAPFEQYSVAPFLALWWLRLRLAAAPLLRLAATLLAPPPAHARLADGVDARPGGMPAAQWRRRAPAVGQWDTLLIAAMLGALTWVLWRKRQLREQRATSAHPPAPASPPPPLQPAAQGPAVGSAGQAARGAALSAAGLRRRGAAGEPRDAAETDQPAAPDAPPTARL